MEENKEVKEPQVEQQEVAPQSKMAVAKVIVKNNLLNICVLVFTGVMTFFTLLAFFVGWARVENFAITSVLGFPLGLYTLPMLLAAPTLKVFMDKSTCPVMKKLNVGAVITIFASILFMTVAVLITFMANL